MWGKLGIQTHFEFQFYCASKLTKGHWPIPPQKNPTAESLSWFSLTFPFPLMLASFIRRHCPTFPHKLPLTRAIFLDNRSLQKVESIGSGNRSTAFKLNSSATWYVILSKLSNCPMP